MKITTVIYARPQFIKAAVVSRAFSEHRPDVCERNLAAEGITGEQVHSVGEVMYDAPLH